MRGFDNMYRKFIPFKIFSKGWGNPNLIMKIIENHKEISKRETCQRLIRSFDVQLSKQVVSETSTIIEGSFTSPFYKLLPESMDQENREAKFQLVTPNKWVTKYRPLCILYARTGDHNYYNRKLIFADRLCKDGIASLIHTNPFYGSRKPKDQWGSSLNYVSDLFVMGGALILEGQVLLHWASHQGFGPLAIQGISMGGFMSCLAASVYPEPVCLIPCLSGTTASHVYTEGAMSQAVSWDILSHQYNNDTVFSHMIRAQIDPPVPYHLQTIVNKASSSSDQSKYPQSTTDPSTQDSHILTLFKDIEKSKDRNTASKRPSDVLEWFRSMELLSLTNPVIPEKAINAKYLSEITNIETRLRNNANLKFLFSSDLKVDKETIEFTRDILDFFTHLGNYSVPIDPRLITAVIADDDKYIPVEGVAQFRDIYRQNIEVKVMKGWDHIGSNIGNYIGFHSQFSEAIVRTLNRYVELYHNETGPFGQKK